LIAGHRQDDIPKKPTSFEGISLIYSTYKASDPDQSRDAASFAVSHRKVSFSYRFEFVPGYGLPGAVCSLYLTADGRPEVEQIGLRLTATKIFRAKANAPIRRPTLLLNDAPDPTGTALSDCRGVRMFWKFSAETMAPLSGVVAWLGGKGERRGRSIGHPQCVS